MTSGSSNPLVAERTDTTTPLAGTFLLEDGEALVEAIESKSWVAGGLAVVSGAFDAAAAISDPIGTLIGMGLGWVLDHIQPFTTWLEQLTGDADQVRAHAETWRNVQRQMVACAESMSGYVKSDLGDMSGQAITAYTGAAGDVAGAISGAGSWAGAMGTALDVTATIVQFVHDFVRDAIAEVVGSILSYAVELLVSVGTALPLVLEQIATRVASLIGRVSRNVTDLVSSARNLVSKLGDLKALFKALQDKLDGLFRGGKTDAPAARSDTPRTNSSTPGASPDSSSNTGPSTVSPAWAIGNDRYIPPSAKIQDDFAKAVQQQGASNPSGWIATENPNYATGHDPWTNNCGPAARSFADTYQGGVPIAAHGDEKCGEFAEMWEITDAHPKSGLTNDGSKDPSDFTSEAYKTLQEKLNSESPGSVAIVGVDWYSPTGNAGGHWFNAYVDETGKVNWVDAQSGHTGPWPPQYDSDVENIDAIVRKSLNSPWRGVDLSPKPEPDPPSVPDN